MGQLDLMDSLRSDIEQIYRPFEKEQFKIAQRICEVSGGINLGDQFSIDFAEREVPMSQDEEIKYYDWAFQNNIETRQSYLRKKNPDLQEEEIQGIVEQIDAEQPQEQDETQSIIDKIGNQVG
jgi:polyhydroxyalkanoate synthesis regulator protein